MFIKDQINASLM